MLTVLKTGDAVDLMRVMSVYVPPSDNAPHHVCIALAMPGNWTATHAIPFDDEASAKRAEG